MRTQDRFLCPYETPQDPRQKEPRGDWSRILKAPAINEISCHATVATPFAKASSFRQKVRKVGPAILTTLKLGLLFGGVYLAVTLAIVSIMHLPKDPMLRYAALAILLIVSLAIVVIWH